MENLKVLINALDDMKLTDIKIFDMKGFSPLYDYLVLANASNDRLAQASAKKIKDEAEKNNIKVKGVEGENSQWILIDCNDVIINIFLEDQRVYYGLDKLFNDIKTIDAKDLIE